VLYASISGLNPTDLVLFVIPALGAALLANFSSLWVTTVAAVLIGCAQSITLQLQSQYTWFPQVGAAEGIPFLIIVIAVIIRGRALPGRGTLVRVRLPSSPEPGSKRLQILLATVLCAAALIFLPFDLRQGILNSLVVVPIALSLVVVTGFAGQISLIQMSIAGLTGLLMTRWFDAAGLGFPFDGIAAVIVAGLCGIVVGLPALRVRGIHLAVLTLGGAYAFENMVLNNPSYLRSVDQNFGAIHAPSIFGFHFGINGTFPIGSRQPPNASFSIFVLLVVVACCAAVLAVRRSDLGRRFLAVRSDEQAAAALGVNVPRTKLWAFAIGAMLAGLGGALSGYQFQSVSSTSYTALQSVEILAIAYLGGISTVSGSLWASTLAVGGIGVVVIQDLFHMGQFQPLIAGLGLVLTAVLNPEGIAGVMNQQWGMVRKFAGGRFASHPVNAASAAEAPEKVPVDSA
jgi:branched-chain amino acid transport system permease protein